MVFSEKFASKTFKGETTKQAYLKAVKWVAKNVMSSKELNNVHVEYVKDIGEVKVNLYVVLPEAETREKHCKMCKEFHGSFFINQEVNCGWCNTKSYQDRLTDMIKVKKERYSEILRRIAGKKDEEL